MDKYLAKIDLLEYFRGVSDEVIIKSCGVVLLVLDGIFLWAIWCERSGGIIYNICGTTLSLIFLMVAISMLRIDKHND